MKKNWNKYSNPYKEMPKVIESRHSSHRTRCRIDDREDYGVTYLTIKNKVENYSCIVMYMGHLFYNMLMLK